MILHLITVITCGYMISSCHYAATVVFNQMFYILDNAGIKKQNPDEITKPSLPIQNLRLQFHSTCSFPQSYRFACKAIVNNLRADNLTSINP